MTDKRPHPWGKLRAGIHWLFCNHVFDHLVSAPVDLVLIEAMWRPIQTRANRLPPAVFAREDWRDWE